MLYKLVGVVQRQVIDTVKIEVEADNSEEAQDLAYEVLSEYPESELVVKRLLRISTVSERPTGIALEFERSETEQVFEEDNDDGDGPEYA